MIEVELMAPAGSPEALKAAVANGAGAVYLGGQQFNAREGAANFNREEILTAIDYAHERGVRVYVTVNILLADRELPAALDYLYFLGSARVDAIIVQDLGLAAVARQLLPELPLIGSTQMTITSAAGARYLQEMGFKRVVLGRELTLAAIEAISRRVDIELEAFVHGALCFSYSGQCLLSSMVGGRSGNRGRCAQPCRLAYTLVDARGRPVDPRPEHLLSTRDLYTLDRVPQLLAAGVRAFKIEGRMRRPEYVAVVTRAYRTIIERCLADPQGFRVLPEEEQAVAQIFNRDFTPGYLAGDPGADLMSYGRPSNRGLYLGRAGRPQGGQFLVHLEAPLHRGDGIDVWVSRGGHQGLVVHHIWQDGKEVTSAPAGATVALELPAATRPGDRIFKTSDIELLRQARDSYTAPREERKITLQMHVTARPGAPLLLEVTDPAGRRVEAQTGAAAAAAVRHPLDTATLAGQLGRLGNTPYRLGELTASLEGPVMVPLSELNHVRREAIDRLRQARLEDFPVRVPPAAAFKEKVEELLKDGGFLTNQEGMLPARHEDFPISDSTGTAAVAGNPGAVPAAAASVKAAGFAGVNAAMPPGATGNADLSRLTPAKSDDGSTDNDSCQGDRRDACRGQHTAGIVINSARSAWHESCRDRRSGLPRLAVAVGDAPGARAALDAGAGRVYLSGETWQGNRPLEVAELRELLAAAAAKEAQLIPALPRLWHETEAAAVARQLERLASAGARLILVANPGGLQLLKENGLAGWGDYPLNAFNTWTLQALAAAGLIGVTLSPEMNLEQLRQLAPRIAAGTIPRSAIPPAGEPAQRPASETAAGAVAPAMLPPGRATLSAAAPPRPEIETMLQRALPAGNAASAATPPPVALEVIVHGALPLMVSAHCVLGARLGGKRPGRACTAPCRQGRYGLKDRLNLVFPITTDQHCRFYLYNAKEISMLDHLGEIAALDLDWVRIEAREKPPEYIRRVTGLYREALDALARSDGSAGEILVSLAQQAEALTAAGITRGHYFRGVI